MPFLLPTLFGRSWFQTYSLKFLSIDVKARKVVKVFSFGEEKCTHYIKPRCHHRFRLKAICFDFNLFSPDPSSPNVEKTTMEIFLHNITWWKHDALFMVKVKIKLFDAGSLLL